MLRPSSDPAAFIEPCLPRPAKQPPAGRGWIHEIKHDGFRIMAAPRRGPRQATHQEQHQILQPLPSDRWAVTLLPVRSCLIDGEAVVCDESGLAVFELIRGYRHDTAAVLCAFDLLEIDGEDLRHVPIEERKGTLAKLLTHPHEGIAFNQHYASDGATIFKHA
jgi:bifunctional non-homologous end joining protein LigD